MQILPISLLLPIAYLTILIGSLATFSHLYRRRQLYSKLRLAPYFPPHTARNVYLSLLHLPDEKGSGSNSSNNNNNNNNNNGGGKPTKVPDSVIRAALLSRACTDIERILEIRVRKPALSQLLQRGVVGDEIWQRLLRAEQELELEVKDVVSEANALCPGWGAVIFQSAGEMVQNRVLRAKLDKVRETEEAEKLAWERTKEQARRELMAEEEAGDDDGKRRPGKAAAAAAVTTTATAVDDGDDEEQQGPTTTTTRPAPKPAAVSAIGSSDDEAVLVERDAAAADGSSQPATNANAGGGGKKKNKKKNKGNKQASGQADS